MTWEDRCNFHQRQNGESDDDSNRKFYFFSVLSKPKNYYKILEVDHDAPEEVIRSNYIRLALKWHPDKQKNEDSATSRFQEINEAYQACLTFLRNLNGQRDLVTKYQGMTLNFQFWRTVLSDPVKRQEYDKKGMLFAYDSNIMDYLNRHKSLILTCNGLGMNYSMW